jgi:hypothetical protein
MDVSMPAATSAPKLRRLIAAGVIRRASGRTIRFTATPAGVTGSIRPLGGAR